MAVDITIPTIGESITEGVLVEWSRANGDIVAVDEGILVLETDKITLTVNAAVAGRLEILVDAGATVEVGQVVGRIDTDVETEAAAPADRKAAVPEPTAPVAPVGDMSRLYPSVQRLVREHGIDPGLIESSGRDGRLLKADVLRFIEQRQTQPAKSTTKPTQETPPAAPSSAPPAQTREKMSRLRRRIAERLVEVQQNAAILTTFNEVDMSRVMALRSRFKEDFERRHGVSLGFMSFFVKAAVAALKAVPEVNAFIDGEDVVRNHYYDIGVAVSTERGLVVPVVRNADALSMAAIEGQITSLAERARDRTLELADLSGAVFTISNGGVFGSMLSTPILNPPGSAILGMHAIKRRPVVVDDEIVIRPMMYLALSYDHRLIDGREAVTFLKRIVELIESPERSLLEV